jgi:hypothetical protein
MHKDITNIVNEIKMLLVKGLDTRKQLTSVVVLPFKFDYTNVLMVEAGGNKVCGYSPCAYKLVSTIVFDKRHRILTKELMLFYSPTCELASKDFKKKLRNQRNIVEGRSKVTNS